MKNRIGAATGPSAFIAVVMSVLAVHGDPQDGLVFKMGFRRDQTAIAENTVGNAVDIGRPGRTSGGNTAARKVRQGTAVVPDPVYSWRSTEERTLDFPQYTTDADGTLRIDPVAMLFSESAVTADVQTVYIRFLWNGSVLPSQAHHGWLALNGYDYSTVGAKGTTGTGWGLSIYNPAIPAGEAEYGYLGWMVPRAVGTIADWGGNYTVAGSAYRIHPEVWYDLFVTIEPSPSDPSKTSMAFRLAKAALPNSKPSWTQNFTVTAAATLDFSPSRQVLRLGSEGVALGWDPLPAVATANDGLYKKSFRGRIARTMIWSRKLSDAEMWEVLAGSSGVDWRIGVENGRADEFAAVDSAEASDEVWATSNTWHTVRRALTQEHPVLAIKDEIPQREEGVAKILSIKPIVSGGDSFPVSIRVNGTTICDTDLSAHDGRAVLIQGNAWRNGTDGHVVVEIVRKPPFSGNLELDAIQLCGGWVMNEWSSMANAESNLYSPYRIGDRDPRTIKGGSSVWPSSYAYFRTQNIVAYVPSEALGRFRYYFSVAVPNASKADLPHSFYMNGRRFAEFEDIPIGTTLTAEIPQECIESGQNTLTVSNGAVNCWCNWSYRIDVRRFRGFTIYFR